LETEQIEREEHSRVNFNSHLARLIAIGVCVAAKFLSRAGSRVLGIIGSEVQARYQVAAFAREIELDFQGGAPGLGQSAGARLRYNPLTRPQREREESRCDYLNEWRW
jgi:ornithine cyclodeaminase/mu-crystallin family protein